MTIFSFKSPRLATLASFAAIIIIALSVSPARANYILTLQEVGPDVVATGSGAIDLTGLTFAAQGTQGLPVIYPAFAVILTGSTGSADVDFYTGYSGPTSFGSGSVTFPNSGGGDPVGIGLTGGVLEVPQGYVSGSTLSDSSTYNGKTFASLGVTPGTYVWSWGAGADQNFTLHIGPATAPETGNPLILLLGALGALAALRRKLAASIRS